MMGNCYLGFERFSFSLDYDVRVWLMYMFGMYFGLRVSNKEAFTTYHPVISSLSVSKLISLH